MNVIMLITCIGFTVINFFTGQYGGEMSELDDAGTYFDLGPKKVTQRGTYHYMCSRNNNFTNRSQKGKIIVQGNSQNNKRIGWNGGEVRHAKYVQTE